MGIENPEISWQNNEPYSLIFNDIYFSVNNGLAETRHVFIGGNDLINRWKNLVKPDFTIIETGFGTGLNFCVTAKTFFDNTKNIHLNYISIEKYPLHKEDIQKALEAFPEIKDIVEKLIFNYPVRMSGIHKIFIDQNIVLTLIFEDRLNALKQLYFAGKSVDAWFLDGFSPSQNEEMWSEELFLRIAEYSKIGTTLSTYSCAGHVRRKLQNAGFDVTKVKGFGDKRQMIAAKITTEPVASKKTSSKPWYYLHNKKNDDKNVAIIGAGLSGCALADAFAKRNWSVNLIDQNKDICSEASGNPLGIFFPVIHRKPTFTSRFSAKSYFYLIRHLKCLVKEGYRDLLQLNANGLLQVFENANEIDRFRGATNINCLDEFYEYYDQETVKNKYGINSQGGIFFKDAGYISPKGLCEVNLARHEKNNPINQFMSQKVGHYRFENGLWQVYDQYDKIILKADVLILANSWAMNDVADTGWLKLQKIRGQLVKPEIHIADFDIPVSAQTYMIPGAHGAIIGATHDRFDDHEIHFDQNLELLHNTYPYFPALEKQVQDLFLKKFQGEDANEAIKKVYSRVSFRSAADDHFPVIGRLPNDKTYNEIFRDLSDGEMNYYHKNGYVEQPGAWRENLYCLTGCGSRGILYSQFGAELIAALASSSPGEILPVEKDLFEALSPARFLYRALKRQLQERKAL